MIDVDIHRKKKIEAVRAMNHLVEKGYQIVIPLQQIRSQSVVRNKYNYKYARYEGMEENGSLIWFCRLRSVN
jgi:hypothetical protein